MKTLNSLSQDALDQLFLKARTHRAWLNEPVPDDLLRQIYDLTKFGPTRRSQGEAVALSCAPQRR